MNKNQVTLAFALNNGYASIEECIFHINNPHVEIVVDKPYKMNFFDDNGHVFKAYPDFYDKSSLTVIEYKAHQLNNYQTKESCQQKLDNQKEFRGKVTSFDKLKFGWNHSMYKQRIVQRTLESLGHKMLVVFSDTTKLSTRNKNLMKKIDLTWCWEKDLPEYLDMRIH